MTSNQAADLSIFAFRRQEPDGERSRTVLPRCGIDARRPSRMCTHTRLEFWPGEPLPAVEEDQLPANYTA
jgi:hypothetical protein